MRLSTSFIDVLFILMFCTVLLLLDSVRLGELPTDPARVDAASAAAVTDPTPVLVSVSSQAIFTGGNRHATAREALAALPRGGEVILVSADADVPHHRVMQVFSELSTAGLRVKLGVQPQSEPTESGGGR